MEKKDNSDNIFVSFNLFFVAPFPDWPSEEFRLAGEFRGDVLSGSSRVYLIFRIH